MRSLSLPAVVSCVFPGADSCDQPQVEIAIANVSPLPQVVKRITAKRHEND